MVGDFQGVAKDLLYGIEYICFWGPSLLRTTDFHHQGDALMLAVFACGCEYHCATPEDDIWMIYRLLVINEGNLDIIIASKGLPKVIFLVLIPSLLQ